MSARREAGLRLVGSVGANRTMERELLRLVKRSPFQVRVPRARRDGDSSFVQPFDPAIAWVAACYHRSCSRVLQELVTTPATRLERLHDDVVAALAADDRWLPARPFSFSVLVGTASRVEAHHLQVRGAVKNAVIAAARRRGTEARLDADAPDVTLDVRDASAADPSRTLVSLDVGGPSRHVRGHRVAMVDAPLRETLAAQLVQASRWDARTEVLVDPMAGGGTIPLEAAALGRGIAVRQPRELGALSLPSFEGFPPEAPPLFPDTVPRIVAADISAERIKAMVGNFRAAGMTGGRYEESLVVRRLDARRLTPEVVAEALPSSRGSTGVLVFNPPYGRRLGTPGGDRELLSLYRDVGRALGAFRGWRIAVFVAHPGFLEAWPLRPVSSKAASNGPLRGAFHLFRP